MLRLFLVILFIFSPAFAKKKKVQGYIDLAIEEGGLNKKKQARLRRITRDIKKRQARLADPDAEIKRVRPRERKRLSS